MTITSTTTKAVAAALFIAGGAATLTAQQLISAVADAGIKMRFQNEHVWVASKNSDGGIPTYASRTCSYAFTSDAGQQDLCSKDGEELSAPSAKAFELYLKAKGIPAPR